MSGVASLIAMDNSQWTAIGGLPVSTLENHGLARLGATSEIMRSPREEVLLG